MIYRVIIICRLAGILFALFFMQGCRQPYDEIGRAVRDQLISYPQSGLQDIYKSFFQDEFGPGHLLSDTAGAWQYLEYELSEMTSSGNHEAEPCGAGKNFIRVPLDLVKDGIISDTALFNAFMQSATSFRIPDIEHWKKKWQKIGAEIERMNLNLPNYGQDKETIAEMLDRGETAVHHSGKYEELYKPHYRILSQDQWEILNSRYVRK
jgi:hypothetical protein